MYRLSFCCHGVKSYHFNALMIPSLRGFVTVRERAHGYDSIHDDGCPSSLDAFQLPTVPFSFLFKMKETEIVTPEIALRN